jgi:hypothetical protein
MSADASDYHHGEMDVAEHVKTYRLFDALSKYGALHVAVLVLFFTLLFCTGTGFFGSFTAALALLVAGIFFLRSKPSAGR